MAGDVLGGRYRLVAPLGKGGMGAVWRAEHLVLSSPVAVKLIHAPAAHSAEAQARFLREAQAAAQLRSPHVVQILDHGVQDGVPFIVMELLEGESLSARLARQRVLSVSETALVVSHVARAIQKAHEAGIVHRDLKPDNVFIVHNADAEIAKVLDFGIAKVSDGFGEASAATHTGAVLGSPHYMSPEQARGTRAVDHRSDLWALGVIAFVCLTGRRPFESDTLGDLLIQICAEPIAVPSRIAPVPPGFDAWFARATERDPDRRFQSASELAESFRQLVAGNLTGVTAHSLPPPSHSVVPHSLHAAPKRASHAWLWLGVSAAALFGVLLLIVAGAVVISASDAGPDELGAPAPSSAPVATPATTEEPPPAAPSPSEPPAKTPRAQSAPPSAKPATTTTAATAGETPSEKLSEAQAKIKAAEKQIKEAEAKIKAAEDKFGAAKGAGSQ